LRDVALFEQAYNLIFGTQMGLLHAAPSIRWPHVYGPNEGDAFRRGWADVDAHFSV
jgi:hypothetical protein